MPERKMGLSGIVPLKGPCYTRSYQFPKVDSPMTMDIEQAYQKGFELRCAGQYAEARTLLQEVLQKDPTHVDARHQIGLIQGFEGDFDGSLLTLQALTTQYPNNLNVRYDLAMTQMMLGLYEEACANLRYILSVNPNHEKALQQAAYC
jgi:tetratricopeptide (TPR) repeat protein